MSYGDLSQMSLSEMFRIEAEIQGRTLVASLLALEREPDAAPHIETSMRAAHSLKGAARVVGIPAGVRVAHAMEDFFVAAQQGRLKLSRRRTELLLRGVDLLVAIAMTPEAEMPEWEAGKTGEVDAFLAALSDAFENGNEAENDSERDTRRPTADAEPSAPAVASSRTPPAKGDRVKVDSVLRVTADSLNRLLGLAGESLVESRKLKPFDASLQRLKRMIWESGIALDNLRDELSEQSLSEQAQAALTDAQLRIIECRRFLTQRLADIETYDRRSGDLAHRLYGEALACRMRPFSDCAHAFPRMVRDLGHALGKRIKLKITGETTQVDRDVLEKLVAPLGHLLRNAADHGIETPEVRRASGKPAEGTVHLEARHSSGSLQITVRDDGGGIDMAQLRDAVIERNLTDAKTAERLSDAEWLEFLFLPGFSMKGDVTEISGRGVGLDIVRAMMRQLRGVVRVSSESGKGTRFQMQLPLTLSLLRAMLASIDGEPYAFPLAHINRVLKIPKASIASLEGRHYFQLNERRIGLVSAHQILEVDEPDLTEELCVVVVGESTHQYGLIVDAFLGERELVVQPLDARLGKIMNVTAGALMDDGTPVLIVDVEDVILSVDKLVSGGGLKKMHQAATSDESGRRKRVLVVDDSLTVRELERKLLLSQGYEVDVAVDGMDGWNTVRTHHFDLVVTDIDMPRMDGIELVTLIKKNPNLKSLPVMVVSYKDREENRMRGLEAGADYYLSKGSFHDETLLQAVVDMIGEAET